MSLSEYYKSLQDKKQVSPEVKEQAAAELAGIPLVDLKKRNKGLFHTLLDILDRPGNATRGLLIGKFGGLKGLIPFAQKIEDLTGIDIALNDEDLTSGGEVVDKLFGIKNKEGKFDLNDVLGMTTEILADPLWLVGAGGLSKAGKLAKLTQSTAKTLGGMDKLKDLARTGQLAAKSKYGKKIADYVNKGGLELAQSLAEQAAKGQRGLLNIAGRPVIKGAKTWEKLDKGYTAYKKSKIGGMFYRPTKKVSSKYSDLDVIKTVQDDKANKLIKDYKDKIQPLYDKASALGVPKEELDDTVRKWTELSGTEKGASQQIEQLIAKRAKKADAVIKKYKSMQKKLSAKSNDVIDARINKLENFFKKGKTSKGKNFKEIQDLEDLIAKRKIQTADFEKSLKPEVLDAAKGIGGEYNKINDELLQIGKNAGADVGQFSGATGFLHRQITPEGADFLKKRPNVNEEISRRKYLQNLTTEEAEQVMREKGFKGKAFFEAGAADPTYSLAKSTIRKAGNRNVINDAIAKYAKPDIDGVPILEAADKFGIDPKRFAGMENLKIPTEVHDALLEMKNLTGSDSPLAALENIGKPLTKYWKSGMTSPWPAFHVRNALSNMLLAWQGGVIRPSVYFKAIAAKAGKKIGIKTPLGDLPFEQVMQQAKELGMLGQSAGGLALEEISETGIRKAAGKLSKTVGLENPLFRAGRKAGTGIEDIAKLAIYFDRLEKGDDFVKAAMYAKKYLFDYNNLSQAEKRIRDIYIPFYTFSRKNIPLQLETLITSPAKQAVFSHAMGGTPEIQGNDKNYPEWWRERLLSKGYKLPSGKEMRVAGFGAPIEEAFGSFAGSGVSATDSLNRIAQRQFTRLSPLITAPVEAITGKDIFYGRDIADTGYAPKWADKAPEFIKKPLGIKEVKSDTGSYHIMNPRTRWAISKSPLSRLWSSASMIAEDAPAYTTASNIIAGLKPRIYDPVKLEQQTQKEEIQKILEEEHRRGKLKRFTRYYRPKGTESDEKVDTILKQQ